MALSLYGHGVTFVSRNFKLSDIIYFRSYKARRVFQCFGAYAQCTMRPFLLLMRVYGLFALLSRSSEDWDSLG